MTPATSRDSPATAPGLRRQLAAPGLVDLPLGVAQPTDQVGDALRQLLGPRLQLLGQAGSPACARGPGSGRRRCPTSASTRRTPAPIEDSPSSLTTPSWPVRATCVPPHSSRAQSPTLTTRTRSPYFSPNSAIAPDARPRSIGWYSAVTSRSSSRTSLTRASTSASTLGGTAPGVREVEPEAAPGSSPSPACVAGLAERLADRLVHHVGRRVRPRAPPARRVDVHLGERVEAGSTVAVERPARGARPGPRTGVCTSSHLEQRAVRPAGPVPGRRAGRRPRRRTACGRARTRRVSPTVAAGTSVVVHEQTAQRRLRDRLVVAGELGAARRRRPARGRRRGRRARPSCAPWRRPWRARAARS